MRQAENKTEPKTESFDDGDKMADNQQQTLQNQLQSQVATSQATSNVSFVDANGNSEGNEILVLVPALNANGLTTANITTEYRENRRNLERKTNDLQNYNHNNRNSIVTEQIVWIPKIEAQSQQDGQHQATTSLSNVCQPPPLYSRIKQLNYSQVETMFL